VPRCFAYGPRPHHGDHPPRRHNFPARGAHSYFGLSRFNSPHLPHHGSCPTRSIGEVQRIMKTSSGRMVKYWIPKIFLTNPSTELSTFSHSM
jgi:hypothetical protein